MKGITLLLFILALFFIACDEKGSATDVQTILENTPELCADSLDNDQDTFVDCNDPDCATITACIQASASSSSLPLVSSSSVITQASLSSLDTTPLPGDPISSSATSGASIGSTLSSSGLLLEPGLSSSTIVATSSTIEKSSNSAISSSSVNNSSAQTQTLNFDRDTVYVNLQGTQAYSILLNGISAKDSVELIISDPSIASLTASKAVVGLALGESKVIAKLKSDTTVSAEMVIKVIVGINAVNVVENIVLLNIHQTHKVLYQLTTKVGTVTDIVSNSDVSDTLVNQLVFELSDSSIADISYNGLIIPTVDGELTVYVAYVGDPTIKDSLKVTVRPNPAQIEISPPVDTLEVVESGVITYGIIPSNADNNITVEIGDSTLVSATVHSGVVSLTATNSGVTDIVLKSVIDKSIIATQIIKTSLISSSVLMHRLVNSTLEDVSGQTLYFDTTQTMTVQLYSTVLPVGATQQVVWKSSDATIATVSVNGLVTMLKKGVVTITLESIDHNSTTNVAINFTEFSTSIISPISSLSLNSQYQMYASVSHSTEGVTWSSSNPSVLSVDVSTGILTSYASTGTAEITATSAEVPLQTDQVSISVVATTSTLMYDFESGEQGFEAIPYSFNTTMSHVSDGANASSKSLKIDMDLDFYGGNTGWGGAGIDNSPTVTDHCNLKKISLYAKGDFDGDVYVELKNIDDLTRPVFAGILNTNQLTSNWEFIELNIATDNTADSLTWANGCDSISILNIASVCDPADKTCDESDYNGTVYFDEISFIE